MKRVIDKSLADEIDNIYQIIQNLDKKISKTTANIAPISKTKQYFSSSSNNPDLYKQRLVGNLPYVLLDKKYFPTNTLLVKFAQKNLKLNLKFARSKSRESLIGSIIVEVVQKEPREIRKFYHAIKEIIGKDETVGVKDFFGEWDKIIKNL